MSVSAVCPQCGFSREVSDTLNGRKAKCPKCNTVFVIGQVTTAKAVTTSPSVPPSPPPSVNKEADKKVPNPLIPGDGSFSLCPTLQNMDEFQKFRTMLLTPLQTPLKSKSMSFGYKFGLLLTALFVILLPIVYVGLIAGFCYLEYMYITVVTMRELEDKGSIWSILGIPFALGAVIVVLLKPLFLGWGEKDTRFEITQQREPLLFDFVQNLCTYIGAPMPKRIFVNCDVNAYAVMPHGIWGAIFGGNNCDLMIGLPLVAGMTTTEFAGVLAHEFGHFTQAGTRRMDYIVRTILYWFAHIYHYRDRSDQMLVTASMFGQLGFVFLLMRFCIWVIRRFIWVLMILGQYVAGFMSRQMEYDADSFGIRLCGSTQFAAMIKRSLMLSIASDKTINDINYMLNEDRLPDNYPLLIAANMNIFNDELDRMATKVIRTSKTGISDTHPCDTDRIAAANEMAEPGVLHVDLPASLFFRNFLGLSREVSLDFYRNEVGMNLEPGMLRNAGAVIDQLRRENLGRDAVIEMFLCSYIQGQFLPLSDVSPSRDVRQAEYRLRQARERQSDSIDDAQGAAKEYNTLENQVRQALYFRELFRIGNKPDMSKMKFSFRSLQEATQKTELFEAQLTVQYSKLSGRDIAVSERIFCARELLKQPEIQNRTEDGAELYRRFETLYPILEMIGKKRTEFNAVNRTFTVVGRWFEILSSLPKDKAVSLWSSIEENTDQMRQICKHCRAFFSDTPYPFEHAKRETTLGMFFVPEWHEVEWGPPDYYRAFGLLSGRLLTTYYLALGECAAITLAVEKSLGLQPLPVPPPEPEEDDEK
ncbi:MAG: M48 family metalloprotease [Planctomycetaceae bacterium]|jgi:Zn-dependent protease with chaperone function|nr:M48 family metalloprotease [Planctomycetaceae bacterium]